MLVHLEQLDWLTVNVVHVHIPQCCVLWDVLTDVGSSEWPFFSPLSQPIKLRGDVRLNVEEKKTRSAREGDRRDIRPRGPGGPRDRIGGSRGPPTRGGMAQKPSFGAGRGTGPSEGRYTGPRQWCSSHVIHCWCKSPWLTQDGFPVPCLHPSLQDPGVRFFFIWTLPFYFWDWTWICCRKTKLLELGKGET